MVLKVSLNMFKTILGSSAKKVTKVSQPITKSMTDSATGIVRLEREITYAGKKAVATVEKMPNGVTKTTITGGGDNPIWRTKKITKENSIFGGEKITVEKEYTKYWCHKEETKLVKEYNPQGILEHKELTYHKNIGNEIHINHKAVQDRVYNEYPLNSGYRDMLTNPNENKYIKHSLDTNNNYNQFADGSATNYTRTVLAKEQAAVNAAKKAEAEALAAKEAAEKAAAELKSKQPRINIAKALNKDINELIAKETKHADGTIERIFTDPETGKILAKTQDKGILHKEWIYGGKADMIYMKQVGNDTPYVVAKKDNYTQVKYIKTDYNWKTSAGKYHKDCISEQYYNDGSNVLKRGAGSSRVYNADCGYITVIDPKTSETRKIRIFQGEAAHSPYYGLSETQQKANRCLKELDNDANEHFINIDDLFSDYKA